MRRYRQRLPILAYHRILDDDTDLASLADPGLFSTRVSDFRRQVDWLTRHADCVTFNTLGQARRCPVIITFDDGYEDNYRLAWPVLRDAGIAGVFFVTTDFIDHGQPLWFDRVAVALRQHDGKLPGGIMPPPEAEHRYGSALEQCLRWMKSMDDSRRIEVLTALEQNLSKTNLSHHRPMSWDQLREMAASGMEIGSHSCSHAVLANETRSRIRNELLQSRQRIEDETGKPCRSLAYPVGGEAATNPIVIDEARKAGYQHACSYISGINHRPPADPMQLHRLHVELDQSLYEFTSTLAFPSVFGYRS
ncbi:MAG: polysaccharide deacetylase family protein [Alcanivoracaceae bacterium]|nr:polysaccharide deacetylase family protein [Alcanivoracaceae bacterium]